MMCNDLCMCPFWPRTHESVALIVALTSCDLVWQQIVAYIYGDKIAPNDAAELLAKRLQQKRTHKVSWSMLRPVLLRMETNTVCVLPRCTWHWS